MTAVPGKVLLWIYAVVPIIGVVILADHFFFDRSLLAVLPKNPEELLFYAIIFNIPHVIASFLSLADADYLRFYGKKLYLGLPILLSAAAVLIYLAPLGALIAYIVFTMYHFRMQQAGTALFFIGKPPRLYMLWVWLSVATASILYAAVRHQSDIASYVPVHSLILSAGFLLVLFFALSYKLFFEIPSRPGRAYFAATASSIFGAFLFLIFGYPFFVIVAGRIIHDATAMLIYAIQAKNRAQVSQSNVLYRVLGHGNLIFVSFPIFAIGFAFALRSHVGAGATFFMLLGVSHYYIEGFVWKRGTIHRDHLPFAV